MAHAGANEGAPDCCGLTALHTAADYGHRHVSGRERWCHCADTLSPARFCAMKCEKESANDHIDRHSSPLLGTSPGSWCTPARRPLIRTPAAGLHGDSRHMLDTGSWWR